MAKTTYRDKRELITVLFTVMLDVTLIGILVAIMGGFIWIFVGSDILVWVVFFIWTFLDWYRIDREARDRNRFIITPGNEDYITNEEMELYNGVGLIEYEYEQVKVSPNTILDILQNSSMKKDVFIKLKEKLKLSKIWDESKVEIIIPDDDDKLTKQAVDEHHFALNFPKHHVHFEDFKIEDLDKKTGRFPRFDQKVIRWIKVNHGVHTLEDLRMQNSADLDREIKSQFKKLLLDGFNLKKEIQFAEEDITLWTARVIFKLLKTQRVKFIKIRELPLFMLYYNYYIYKVKFDREVPTIYKRKDGTICRKFSQEVYMILPQSWNESFKFTSREIPFKGYYPTCPDVAQIEWVFREFILKDLPVYFVNSCWYTRQRIQKDLTVDNDEIMLTTVQIMTELYLDEKKESKKQEMFKDELQIQVDINEGREKYAGALKISNLDLDQRRKDVNMSWKPTKTIYLFKWLIVALFIIVGVSLFFGGMYFGGENVRKQLIDTVIP